ncbi:unnamed protein product [Coffea canephora]|uniref:Alcohol dehydrogenase-like N-terminal domain-containing protein n=1 Tax=Coffea canephora TaxID=49390 RepID=A0A068U0A1_COFCA|nr:unnamed protein product [Coffea canephora]
MAKSPETEHPIKAFGWAARDHSGSLPPFKFSRRATGDNDVQFKVMYCGISHSDIHMMGHEQLPHDTRNLKVGDKVGVGCQVQSCRKCDSCNNNLENYCSGLVQTYGAEKTDGTITYGGYSNMMVCHEHFVVRWPENLPMDAGAPLLCAGITTYSPLRYYGLDKPGMHIGIVGLGGLGHVAVKMAKAFGTKATVISTNINKKKKPSRNLELIIFWFAATRARCR